MHWLPWWVYPAGLCFLFGASWGYLLGHSLGYAHRDLIEWGRRLGRLLAWQRKYRRKPRPHPYRELLADIERLCATGRWT